MMIKKRKCSIICQTIIHYFDEDFKEILISEINKKISKKIIAFEYVELVLRYFGNLSTDECKFLINLFQPKNVKSSPKTTQLKTLDFFVECFQTHPIELKEESLYLILIVVNLI